MTQGSQSKSSVSKRQQPTRTVPSSNRIVSERINESMTPDEIDIYGFQS